MTLIEAVREAVCCAASGVFTNDVIYATFTGDGLKIEETENIIPMDRVDVPPIFKGGITVLYKAAEQSEIQPKSGEVTLKSDLLPNDKVAALVHHDGQRFSILYKI